MFDKKLFAERLKSTRKSKRLNQQALADFASVGRTNITMLETGERSPSVEVLVALAECLDVSIDYLVGRSDIREESRRF